VFATSRDDGAVWSTFFQKGRNWQNWFPIHPEGPQGKMKPGATVAALQPFAGHVDLFSTRNDGTVMSTFFEVDGGWREWFEIHPETRMGSGATVTVLQPFAGHVDLFVIGDNRSMLEKPPDIHLCNRVDRPASFGWQPTLESIPPLSEVRNI
jgi:hypothetical protein